MICTVLFFSEIENMQGLESIIENSELGFKYLLNLALNEKVPWAKVKGILDDLVSTYEMSKKLNKVVLNELELLHSKVNENQESSIERKEQEIIEDNIIPMQLKQESFNDKVSNVEKIVNYEEIQVITECEEEIVVDNDNELHEGFETNESNDLFDGITLSEDERGPTNDTGEGRLESNISDIYNDLTNEINHSQNEVALDTSDETESVQVNNFFGKEVNEDDQQVHNSLSSKSKEKNKKQSWKNKEVFINGERRYSCQTCGELFTFSTNLKKHERIHSGEKPFECKYCDKKFSQVAGLTRHERTHTGVKPFQCQLCNRRFSQMYNLKRHETIHRRDEISFKCQNCEKKFKTREELRDHKSSHRVPCEICGQTFGIMGNLKKHKRIHSGERPFGCKYCSKRFVQSQSLKIHERIHTGERPYQCKQYEKTFRQMDSFKKHANVHSDEKLFECESCPKKFKSKQEVVQHCRNHSQQLEFQCKNCKMKFRHRSSLKHHIKKCIKDY